MCELEPDGQAIYIHTHTHEIKDISMTTGKGTLNTSETKISQRYRAARME